jgi:hypothetical protein
MFWWKGATVAQIRTVVLADARSRLKPRTPGYQDRAPLRAAIANMTTDRMLELEPDAGESVRSMKSNVTRAAKEVDRSVRYGESYSGTLLVWLEGGARRRSPRRRRPSGTDGE